jgi:hypothetical protein
LFTAVGSGAPVGVSYQYRFWLNNGSGNVLVQDYSANPLWALPVTTIPGSYNISVDVRTNFGLPTPDATAIKGFVIIPAPLTINFTVNNPLGGTLTGTTTQTVASGGTTTTVTAVANPGYVFVNWTALASGFLSTNAALTVANVTAALQYIANFASTTETAFKIGANYFTSIQEAYNAAVDGDTIQVYAGTQSGTLNTTRPVNVKLSGGWNTGYTVNDGRTTIHSKVTVNSGSIRLLNINVIP